MIPDWKTLLKYWLLKNEEIIQHTITGPYQDGLIKRMAKWGYIEILSRDGNDIEVKITENGKSAAN